MTSYDAGLAASRGRTHALVIEEKGPAGLTSQLWNNVRIVRILLEMQNGIRWRVLVLVLPPSRGGEIPVLT